MELVICGLRTSHAATGRNIGTADLRTSFGSTLEYRVFVIDRRQGHHLLRVEEVDDIISFRPVCGGGIKAGSRKKRVYREGGDQSGSRAKSVDKEAVGRLKNGGWAAGRRRYRGGW